MLQLAVVVVLHLQYSEGSFFFGEIVYSSVLVVFDMSVLLLLFLHIPFRFASSLSNL